MTMNKYAQSAYNFAKAKGSLRNSTLEVLSDNKNFHEKVDDDLKANLTKGFSLYWLENNEPSYKNHYVASGEGFVPVDDVKFKAFKGEKVELTASLITAYYDKQPMANLKRDNERLHTLILQPRRTLQKYVSDRIKDMQAEAKKILAEKEGKTVTRAPNKTFGEKVDKHFESMKTELISAKSKGDDTANEARFSKAKVAFMTAWLHG